MKLSKDFIIAGTSLSIGISLLAIFILGYHIWFTLPGMAMAVIQIILAFGFTALNFKLKQLTLQKQGQDGSFPMPLWVRVWQLFSVFLFIVIVVIYYQQAKQLG